MFFSPRILIILTLFSNVVVCDLSPQDNLQQNLQPDKKESRLSLDPYEFDDVDSLEALEVGELSRDNLRTMEKNIPVYVPPEHRPKEKNAVMNIYVFGHAGGGSAQAGGGNGQGGSACPSTMVLKAFDSCLEIGCILEQPCKLKNLNNFTCCPYVYQGISLSCCHATVTCLPETCPEHVPADHVCLEEGCVEGERCQTRGIVDKICCRMKKSRKWTTCCIKPVFLEPTEKKPEEKRDPSCPPFRLSKTAHCLEIGCEVGERCHSEGLEDHHCCTQKIKNFTVTCCVKEETTAPLEIPLNFDGCAPYHVSFPYQCLEIGCEQGEQCKTPELKSQKCCPHNMHNNLITCCVVKSETEIPTTEKIPSEACQNSEIPPNYNCMEMGCEQGTQCKTYGLEDEKCCLYQFRNTQVTCCLALPIVSPFPLTPISPDVTCPPVEFPRKYHCMEIGCRVGDQCITEGLDHMRCCPHKYMKKDITCCLAIPARPRDPQEKCPALITTEQYHCLSIGCNLGESCQVAGADIPICCPHVMNGMLAHCCLKKMTEEQPFQRTTPSSTESLKCIDKEERSRRKYNCMYMGCIIESKCEGFGMENQKCCPYHFQGQNVNCCLQPADEIITPSPDTPVEGCPIHMKLPRGFQCMEVGCQIGKYCNTVGAEGILCCPYDIGQSTINCCLKRPIDDFPENGIEPPETQDRCPPEIIPEMYHCLEVECAIGTPCETKKLEDNVCCKHSVKGVPINCCLAKPSTDNENAKLLGCPAVKRVPIKDECMEIGCPEGNQCTSAGVEGQTCCPYLAYKSRITCCLRKPSDSIIAQPYIPPEGKETDCPSTKIPPSTHCMEIGCNVGEKCTSKGLEMERCCNYELPVLIPLTCCLAMSRSDNETLVIPGCQAVAPVPKKYQCMEIGCSEGRHCSAEGVEGQMCCPYLMHGFRISCCLRNPNTFPMTVKPAPEFLGQCPPKDVPDKYHCMEIDCLEGEPCMTKGLQGRHCCKHTVQNVPVTCCLAKPSFDTDESSIVGCPTVAPVPPKHECLEIGCSEGQRCTSVGAEGRTCCPYLVNNFRVSCCLQRTHGQSPIVSPPDIEEECPATEIPTGLHCMELGCKPGERCLTVGLHEWNRTCCNHLTHGVPVTCCLGLPRFDKDITIPGCPAVSSIPEKYQCMEIMCTEGRHCSTEGVEGQVCCPYLSNGFRVSCCLKKPSTTFPSPIEPPPGMDYQCPAIDVPRHYHCMEIGCTVGEKCITKGLESRVCCSHKVSEIPVTCCLALPKKTDGKITLPGCPPLSLVPLNFHCMEIGCVEGQHCTSSGVEGQICCPYILNRNRISCCLKSPQAELPDRPQLPPATDGLCPNVDISEKYHCMEIGCHLEDHCQTKGMENRVCCLHKINYLPISCCLAMPSSQHDRHTVPGCPALQEVPKNFKCMEIGCTEGQKCTAEGVEGQSCCPYLLNKFRISCCLKKGTSVLPGVGPKPAPIADGNCPRKNIPKQYHCMEIGCNIGNQCVTKGLQQLHCCSYVVNEVPVTCCLALPTISDGKQTVNGCPSLNNIAEKYRCMEIGCSEGRRCTTRGVEWQVCCPYLMNGFRISCCLKQSTSQLPDNSIEPPPLINQQCPAYDITTLSHCMEIGCNVGDPCTTKGLEKRTCCKHEITGIPLTCCLAQPREDSESSSILGCPPLNVIPIAQQCMEIGCTEGQRCATEGVRGQPCCPYVMDGNRISCCLKNFTAFESGAGVQPASVEYGQCPAPEIPLQYHCMEIGCTKGNPCRTKGLETRVCCPHEINYIPVFCCLAKPNYPSHQRTIPGCPILNNVPEKYKCMEIGCIEGKPCTTEGVEGQICCPYLLNEFRISCCLKRPASVPPGIIVIPAPAVEGNCPAIHIPPNYHCMEIGCTVGNDCITKGLQEQECCNFKTNYIPVTCCLAKPTFSDGERKIPGCPLLSDIPRRYECMEIGCTEGQRCTSLGVEGQTCCPYILLGFRISCCLKRTSSLMPDDVKPSPIDDGRCPAMNIPNKYHCMSIGCEEGDKCIIKGLENRICCRHRVDDVPVTCCLAVPQFGGGNKTIPGCGPLSEIARKSRCLEIGCIEGHHCSAVGAEGMTCCPHLFEGGRISCCIESPNAIIPGGSANPPTVTEGKKCSPDNIRQKYHCMEIGCAIDQPCTTNGLNGHFCCHYKIFEVPVTCCLAVPSFDSEHKATPGCSLLTQVPEKYSCMEIGCTEGRHCSTAGVEGQICCPFILKGFRVSCCIKRPSAVLPGEDVESPPIKQNQCPDSIIPSHYHCMEIGCIVNESCTTKGLQDRVCCNHLIKYIPVTCCLAKPRKGGTSYTIPGCPVLSKIPPNYMCMEIGCTEGHHCTSLGVEGQTCCPYIWNRNRVNCCLKKPTDIMPSNFIKPPSLQHGQCGPEHIPHQYHCMEIGCSVGHYCTTKGLQGQICCNYKANYAPVTCCLGIPSFDSTAIVGCPPLQKIMPKYNCMEIGCSEGQHCTKEGVAGQICCPYIYNNFRVSCCLRRPTALTPSGYFEPPPVEIGRCSGKHIPPTYHCMEVGCVAGNPCITKGLEGRECCNHDIDNIPVTCCLAQSKDSSIDRALPGCPPLSQAPEKYNCMEIDCVDGSHCISPGVEGQVCCPYLFNGFRITCCLKNPSAILPDGAILPPPLSPGSCPPINVLPRRHLLEIGCKEGELCTSKGMEGLVCCPHLVNGVPLTGCLSQANDQPVTPVDGCSHLSNIPIKYQCMEIGCIEGQRCNSEGVEGQTCCPYILKDFRITCCLKKPSAVLPPDIQPAPGGYRQCPSSVIREKYHCLEIGCTEGDRCTTMGLQNRLCCYHTINNIPVTCCLAASSYPTGKETIPGCPPVSFVSPKYECMEIGCTEGKPCITEGVEGQTCCPYLYNGFRVSCCLKPPSALLPSSQMELPQIESDGCPIRKIPDKHHCMEIGCLIGSQCTTKGLEKQKCCMHRIDNIPVSCCLTKGTLNKGESSIPGCPPLKSVPLRYNCFEAGCSEGRECTTSGVQGQTCCPYLNQGFRISCCLKKEASTHEGDVVPLPDVPQGQCPPVNIPQTHHCINIGCNEGEQCITKGLEGQVCCRHKINYVPVTCCLGKPTQTGGNIPGCPAMIEISLQNNCFEAGCEEGKKCTTAAVEGQMCCPFLIQGFRISCCLRSLDQTPKEPVEPPSLHQGECPLMKVPEKYHVMEFGCTLGDSCQTPGLESLVCCRLKMEDAVITGCLAKPTFPRIVPGCTVPFEIPLKYNCLETGCTAGQLCSTTEGKGLRCCPYLKNNYQITCCLKPPGDIEVIPIPLENTNRPGIFPTRPIPESEGYILKEFTTLPSYVGKCPAHHLRTYETCEQCRNHRDCELSMICCPYEKWNSVKWCCKHPEKG